MSGGDHEEAPRSPAVTASLVVALFASLYCFLCGLAMMSDAFNILTGKTGASMFGNGLQNPIVGLMVGIIATVLVQSSSTSTSIVVVLVGVGQITVRDAVPIIMGANIGTSVTNTLVSMGHMNDRKELRRAFAGATVHDMFNLLAVATLLPVEILTRGAAPGEGFIQSTATGLVDGVMGGINDDFPDWLSAIKDSTKMVTEQLYKLNKDLIRKVLPISTNEPGVVRGRQQQDGEGLCSTNSSSAAAIQQRDSTGAWADVERRLQSADWANDCTGEAGQLEPVVCISADLDTAWKEIEDRDGNVIWEKDEYRCSNHLSNADSVCNGPFDGFPDVQYVCGWNANAFWHERVLGGDIVVGGMLGDWSDFQAGSLVLTLSFVCLIGGLILLVKILHKLLLGPAKEMVKKATNMNDYLAIVVGVLITIAVQSSSITTSALTPLVGIGVLSVSKMFPVTLGANIGTTSTGLIAAAAASRTTSLEIALCHFLFNIIGILIWFPIPFMRNIPISAAKTLGLYASFYRWIPMAYIITAFFIVPAVLLLTGTAMDSQNFWWAGYSLLVVEFVGIVGFGYWWNFKDGAYTVLSKEQREEAGADDEDSVEMSGDKA